MFLVSAAGGYGDGKPGKPCRVLLRVGRQNGRDKVNSMKTIPLEQFHYRISQAATRHHLPARVMFELTYRCNFACGYCYVPDSFRKKYQKRELNTKQVFYILDQLKEVGCFYLGFTGGEVFLRQDIWTILWHARKSFSSCNKVIRYRIYIKN